MSGMGDSITARVVSNKQVYCSIYEQMKIPCVTQSWAWGEAKRTAEKWDVVRLAFNEGHIPVGLCQILRKKRLGIATVSRINRGPLFRAGSSDTQKLRILSELRSRFRHMRAGILLIAPGMRRTEAHVRALRSMGFFRWKAIGWHSSLINLRRDTDEIRGSLHRGWRRSLKRGEKSGLLLNVSSSRNSLELLIEKHEHNMRQKGFVGPSRAFLQALYMACPEDAVVLTVSAGAAPLCGMVVLRHGMNSEGLVGWFSEGARRMNAGNFLYWQAVVEMKRRGCHWLDLGGFGTRERYGRFKIGMGGDEYDLVGEWCCF